MLATATHRGSTRKPGKEQFAPKIELCDSKALPGFREQHRCRSLLSGSTWSALS